MAELNFDIGIKTYSINDKVEVSFNPADDAFAHKVYDSLDKIAALQEKYDKTINEAKDKPEIFDVMANFNKDIRAAIDEIFNQPVSNAVFGDVSAFAFSEGEPIWHKFMMTIVNELEGAYAAEEKKARAKIAKYTKKYDVKYHR